MNDMKTGQLIAEIRREKGLTQKQLAERLHISDRTVSKWECGKGFPDPSLLEPLSEALQVPLSALIRGERVETSPGEEIRMREMIRILHGAWRARRLRILKRIILIAAAVIFTEAVIFQFRTGGDGMRHWQFVRMFRENYELTCDQFSDRGVSRIEWISGEFRTVITDHAAIGRILTVLEELEAGEEYQHWGPGSVQGYLLITTDDGGLSDSTFVLSFPAFTVSSVIGETKGRFFYYEARVDGKEAFQVIEALIDSLAGEGRAERYALGRE